jgi:hypothetical protein
MTDFGYNTIGTAGNDNPADNWIWCKATSTPASNGTLTSISVHGAWDPANNGGNVNFCTALYTDSAGVPSALVVANETPVSATSTTFSWISQSFSQAITAGTQYWFGIRVSNYAAGNHRDLFVKFDTNGGATEGYFKVNAALAAFPATVTSPTSFTNERWSVYGTYTPSATVKQRQFGTMQAVRRAADW